MMVMSCLHLFIFLLFVWFVEWLTGVVRSVNTGWSICASARHSDFLRSIVGSGAAVNGGDGGSVGCSIGGAGSVCSMGMENMSGCGGGGGGMG